jgi:hypothetical protein
MIFHLNPNRSVGANLSPMDARGPAPVASPGHLVPVHFDLLRPAGVNSDQRPGRAITAGGVRRNSIPSLALVDQAAGHSFKRGKFCQAAIDCLCVLAAFALIGVTGLAIAGSVFVLFFIGL